MPMVRVSNGGTAKEVYTRFSYFAGYDLENERTISQTSAYTVNGNYISITRNTQQTGYTITCTIPCTVRYYSTNGLVREHVLTSVSQTATGLFEDESIGSWVVF